MFDQSLQSSVSPSVAATSPVLSTTGTVLQRRAAPVAPPPPPAVRGDTATSQHTRAASTRTRPGSAVRKGNISSLFKF